MANLSAASRRNSAASSAGSSPRPSLSAARTMLSLDESRIDELDDKNRGRICSERSDSGISDCSAVTNSSVPLHACDSITEEDVQPEERRTSVDLTTIRKKFASLSQNIYEMDKQLENMGRQLGDIGDIKITREKPEITRVPSLKDKSRTSKLTVPRSPEMKTKTEIRESPPPSVNGKSNVSVCAVRSPQAGGLSASNKRAEFVRLQQVFSSNAAANQKVEAKPMSATGEAPRTRTSPTFQKTVAFWKR